MVKYVKGQKMNAFPNSYCPKVSYLIISLTYTNEIIFLRYKYMYPIKYDLEH